MPDDETVVFASVTATGLLSINEGKVERCTSSEANPQDNGGVRHRIPDPRVNMTT